MSFTVSDFQDLIRLLEAHPEWRAELRRLLLTDQILALPEIVRRLAEAQERVEAQLAELVQAQRQSAEAQRRTDEHLALVDQRLAELAEAQRRTEERLQWLIDTVGDMRGTLLEYRYRERVAAYFGPSLRRVRAVPIQELEDTLEERLSAQDLNELFQLDLLVRGMPRHIPEAPEVWLAIEVSAVVDAGDVARARRRAALLSQAGYPAVPVATGEGATQGAQEEPQAHQVVLLQDGRTLYWNEALTAWLRRPEAPR
ncbi:MAG: hypothetical protein C4289_12380 [Chloroflexota bacterium]